MSDGLVECPDCKAPVPEMEGPTHPYIGASAGCWCLYGEVLAREYEDTSVFRNVHRLAVDAYAVQHPGKNERRSAQSVNVHLVALYLSLEKQMSPGLITAAMAKLIQQHASELEWLDPPKSLGDIRVTDVWLAETPEAHAKTVLSWAHSAWDAWKSHHDRIAKLAESVI